MNQRFLLTLLVCGVFTVLAGVCAEIGLPALSFAFVFCAGAALCLATVLWE